VKEDATGRRTSLASEAAKKADVHAAGAHALIGSSSFGERDGVAAHVEALLAIDSRLKVIAEILEWGLA
jgi:hypothetical protein